MTRYRESDQIKVKESKVCCRCLGRELWRGSQVAEPTPWSRRSVAGGLSRGNFLFRELRATKLLIILLWPRSPLVLTSTTKLMEGEKHLFPLWFFFVLFSIKWRLAVSSHIRVNEYLPKRLFSLHQCQLRWPPQDHPYEAAWRGEQAQPEGGRWRGGEGGGAGGAVRQVRGERVGM